MTIRRAFGLLISIFLVAAPRAVLVIAVTVLLVAMPTPVR